jgi:malate dehydrogenase (oxaloacetate-decarboxylating)(NADP+)
MVAPAVAQAAMDSGVATRPIADMDGYRERITNFVFQSGLLMKPVFDAAKRCPLRVVYAEGGDERVLHAVRTVVDEKLAKPILLGDPAAIGKRIEKLGLRLQAGRDYEIADIAGDARHPTLIAANMVRDGLAEGMLCGVAGKPQDHLPYVREVIGLRPGASVYAAMNILMLKAHTLFICDTHVNLDPTAEQIAEMTLLAAEEVRRFGFEPRVALLSHSNFGSFDDASARKMGRARELLARQAPDLEVEGEIHGDAAVSAAIRAQVFPGSRLTGDANLLVMPSLDAANIAFNLLKVLAGDGITIGPVLLGAAKPVHVLTNTATVRRIVNMSALAVASVNTTTGES